MLEKGKELSLFLLAAAVGCGEGRLASFAGVIALIVMCCDKDRFCNLKNKYFKWTLILYAIFVCTLYFLSVYMQNKDGMSDALRYLEKAGPFLGICLFLGRIDRFLPVTALGLATGFFVNDVIVLESWMHHAGRLGGLFGHPNKLGGCITLVLPFFCYFCWYFRQSKKLKAVMLVSIIMLLVCLGISGSRGAIIGCIWEAVLAICFYLYRKGGSVLNKKIVLETIAAFLVGVILMSSVETFHARSYDHERVLLWTAAWQMFIDHPITGVGLLHFNNAYVAHYLSPLAKEPNLPHPHNLFLNFLAETGLVGFSAYMLLILGQVVIAFRFTQNIRQLALPDIFILAVVGMFGHGMVDVLATTRDQMLLYFFLWGIICLYFKTREDFR